MPELPEVETVRMGLAPAMEGRVIERAIQRRPDLRWPLPERFAERLTGRRILRLGRRSKYILGVLDGDETLLIHLGMSGRMTVGAAPVGEFHHAGGGHEKHDHVEFWMEGGQRVVFNDARRFGAMDLFPTGADHPLLAALGPEPRTNAFHADYLAGRLKGKMTPIKSALLDQKIIAGLGNIYVCEALWRAKISPLRLAGDVSAKECARLTKDVKAVLTEAIASGGSSLKDYRQADGALGYFQHAFAVYDRDGHPCPRPRCGGGVERIAQSGRSTFFCPDCQS